jgi:transposase
MAHARRMFNDALDNDEPRASHALQQIKNCMLLKEAAVNNRSALKK